METRAPLSPADKRALLARLMRSGDAPFPLSYGQQSLWFMDRVRREASVAYNMPFAWTVHDDADPVALRGAFEWLIARHPIFRTTYGHVKGTPVQRVAPTSGLDFFVADLAPGQDLAALLGAEAARPFDLEHGPVLRVVLVRRPAAAPVLLWVTHHIAIDGWSLFQLLEELGQAYTALRNGVRPSAAPPAATYADFVAWQAAMLAGPDGARMEAYWTGLLADPPPVLALPTDRPRPADQGFQGSSYAFRLGAERSAAVEKLAARGGSTLYTTLLAAFQVLLGRASGQEDFLLGTWTSGRSRPEFSDVVGYFVNPVVLRADLSGDPGFSEVLGRTREAVLDALDNQDYPFPRLVERLGAHRDPSRSPLFDVAFTLRASQRGEIVRADSPEAVSPLGASSAGERGMLLRLGELALSTYPLDQATVRFDVELELVSADGEISGLLRYDTGLFDEATIAWLAEGYLRVLDFAAGDPGRPVGAVPWEPRPGVVTRDGAPTPRAPATSRGDRAPHTGPPDAGARATTTGETPTAGSTGKTGTGTAGTGTTGASTSGTSTSETSTSETSTEGRNATGAGATELLETVVGIWSEVLGLDPGEIAPDDDFFDLGGHSLAAVQVAMRIQDRLGVEVSISDVFHHLTPAELAGWLAGPTEAGPRPVPRTPGATYPLSHAQESLWVLNQLAPRSPAYNAPHAFRLRGPLDVEALEWAIGRVVSRHESLRTTFTMTRRGPVQRVTGPAPVPLPVVETADAAGLVLEEYRRPFDLARGPLLRPVLYRVSPTEHVLLVLAHHIVFDGWSTAVFWRELCAFYRLRAEGSGSCAEPPEPGVQYVDFAVWERESLTGDRLAGLVDYWRERLADSKGTALPTDLPRPRRPLFQGAQHAFDLPVDVRELCRATDTTPHMVYLAAFKVWLARRAGTRDVVVGSVVSGRSRTEVADLVGHFVNTLAVRTHLGGTRTFSEVVGRVRQSLLGAYEHQELPLSRLTAELGTGRGTLFDVLFTLHDRRLLESADDGLPGVTAERLFVPLGTSQFDLALEVTDLGGSARAVLEYDTALFRPETVAGMAAELERTITALVTAPDLPLSP
ncbi:condensation domain-containing protein [Streptosporangium sp. NPDC002721]|uniref:condensation domain-containing protein n=1 Tax=Streptosporangium sp. NPDC002721 TaxID=3366188 RepID=UPI003698C73C